MRQIHLKDKEGVQNGQYSHGPVLLASDQQTDLIPRREILHHIEQAQPTAEELLRHCARDTPRLEALNFLTYLSTPVLFLILLSFLFAGDGAGAVVTCSSLIGMNYGMRRAIRRGYARDAEEFAELGPETLGQLLDYVGRPNTRIEAVTSQVLAQLLPTLSRDQFDALSPLQRTSLYTWLRDGSRTFADSKITVLLWLVDVADAEAIGYIEELASRVSISAARRRLRKEARSALALILERLDKEHFAADWRRSEGELATRESALAVEDELETTEESRALLAQIRKHSEHRSSPGMRMGYLIANWCFITPYVAFMFWNSLSMHWGFVESSIWLVLTAASTQLYRLSLTPAHTRMARQLANTSDTHAIGALAEALEWPDPEIQTIARGALIRLLPKLTNNDAPLLNSRQRRSLNNMLVLNNSKNYLDSELQVKILQAWEKVGDLSSLQTVKSLAAAKAMLVNERKVQKAAIKCLPLLEERAHLNESSQMLLRASSNSNAGAETLVRPASTNETRDDELLRPSE